MPVRCDIDFERLSTEAFSSLDYTVMGSAFDCHNQLGRLANERIYEGSLAARLTASHLPSLRQVPIVVSHGSYSKTYFLDLVVSRMGVYELKTVSKLNNNHVAQLMTYLYLLDLPRGKLVNFRGSKVDSQFVNAPLSRVTRTSFSIESSQYTGGCRLLDLSLGLLNDLGTSLSISLYQNFLIALLGGEGVASAMLPIADGAKQFGNQRFLLASPTEGLRVTCFSRIPEDYEQQIRSLIQFSPLTAIQWINVDVETVSFQTVTRT